MPAGGAFGEKGLESLKVAFLQGIECSMRDGQISFLEWGQFDVVNVSHVAASALVGQRGTFPATPCRFRMCARVHLEITRTDLISAPVTHRQDTFDLSHIGRAPRRERG